LTSKEVVKLGDLVEKAKKVRGQPFEAAELIVEIATAIDAIEARVAALEAMASIDGKAQAKKSKTSKDGKGKK
jgi:hypothetical protein